jgi:O-antigen ligase
MIFFKDSRLNKWFLFSILTFAFTLPLLRATWHGVFFGIVVLLGFGSLILKGRSSLKEFRNYFFSILVYWVLLLFGLFYSQNLSAGLSFVETQVPLLILPLLVLSTRSLFSLVEIRKIVIAFIVGVIILNLACLAFISYDLWDYKNLQANLVIANYSLGQIHPTFLSLYIAFGIFFFVDQYFPLQGTDRSKLGWVLFGFVVLIVYLIWINSRTGILSFLLASIFYITYKYKGGRRLIGFGFMIILIIAIFSIPFSRERFVFSPLRVLNGEVIENHTDPNVFPLLARKNIYQCSFDLISGPEFFYGYGTGDFRDVLQACYKARNFRNLQQAGLDSHNEYLAQFHRNGILGLLAFIALLAIPFFYAIRNQSPLLGVFVILFASTAFFENVFSSQKGATFFALFCPLLILLSKYRISQTEAKEEVI